jgi:hypothetical protein
MGFMKSRSLSLKVAGALALGMLATTAFAEQKFELVTGKPFDQAVPKDFYLEGNAIPTEKRNAAVVKTPSGGRAVFALIDTAGYSADITTKYVGMLITEGDLQVCGKTVTTGSYGFGWKRPATGVNEPGTQKRDGVPDPARRGHQDAEAAAGRDRGRWDPSVLRTPLFGAEVDAAFRGATVRKRFLLGPFARSG